MIDLSQLAVAAKAFGIENEFVDVPNGKVWIILDHQKLSDMWDGESEEGTVAFAMLDAMERAGYRPGIYLLADNEKEPGSEPKEPVYCSGSYKVLAYGPNRTQAIARQLIALHEAGVRP